MLGMPVVLHTLAVVAGRLHMLLVQQLAVDTLVPEDILPVRLLVPEDILHVLLVVPVDILLVVLLVPRTLAVHLQVDVGLWLELRAAQLRAAQLRAAQLQAAQQGVAAGRSELQEVAVAPCTAVAS